MTAHTGGRFEPLLTRQTIALTVCRRGRLVAAVVAWAALSACSGPAPTARESGPGSALTSSTMATKVQTGNPKSARAAATGGLCDLLPVEAVNKIVGTPAGPSSAFPMSITSRDLVSADDCAYPPPSLKVVSNFGVLLSVTRYSSTTTARRYFGMTTRLAGAGSSHAQTVALSGGADEGLAVFLDVDGSATAVVRKGPRILSLGCIVTNYPQAPKARCDKAGFLDAARAAAERF